MKRLGLKLAALLALGACSDATSSATAAADGGSEPSVDGGVSSDGGVAAAKKTVTFLTLNMHGYHATDEAPRFFEDRAGTLTPAISSPFYFKLDELFRGNTKRLDALAADLKTRLPDILALQEVAAGAPDTSRDCGAFDADAPGDEPHTNTARRLARRLSNEGYTAILGCRGNVGWTTDAGTFASRRIVRAKGDVVFDFDANPYPQGMLVEGFALLVKSPLAPIDQQVLDLPYDAKGDRIKAQLVAVALDGAARADDAAPWLLVVNVHGGHKVAHFEQAVATREAVSAYVKASPRRASLQGVVFIGDFNARLHRPNAKGVLEEAASAPWEMFVDGQFDYRKADDAAGSTALGDALVALNASSYKSFATLPAAEAKTRIDAAITRMRTWQKTAAADGAAVTLEEALFTTGTKKTCSPPDKNNTACELEARIDHVFFGGKLALDNAYALYTRHDDHLLAGTLSDHPGVLTTFSLPRSP